MTDPAIGRPGPQPWNADCPPTLAEAMRRVHAKPAPQPAGDREAWLEQELREAKRRIAELERRAAAIDKTVAKIRLWAGRVMTFIGRVQDRLNKPKPSRSVADKHENDRLFEAAGIPAAQPQKASK